MSITTIVLSTEPGQTVKVRSTEYELAETLGESDKNIAVRLDEIVKSLSETLRDSVVCESEVQIEISGSITLKAEGGAKWLFFNVGGEAASTAALKVSLKTTISPTKAK